MDTFASLGTRGAIEKLYSDTPFQPCTNPYFECGNGYATTSGVTLLEGIDFDLRYFPLKHLGYKAVVCASGELMSVMARAQILRVTVGVSAKLDYPQVSQIWEGVVSGASLFGYRSVALDLNPSLTGLVINVSATGFTSREAAAKRPIAKSMDLICISDNAGAAFLGSKLLSRDGSDTAKLEKNKQLIGAYIHPELSPYTLSALEDADITPSFGYFVHHSLRETLLQLQNDSGLGVKVYVDKLPLAGGSVDAARELGVDPLQAAMRGGDDSCLLFTIPIGSHEKFRRDFQNWDVIGHLARPEVGAVMVSPDGLEHSL